MNNPVFLNNEFIKDEDACLHYRDLAIMRGYGIFDFFKVVNGQAVHLEDHLDRFYFSAGEMRLPVERSREEIRQIVSTIITANPTGNYGIRLTLTGGYSNDGYSIARPNLIISLHHFQQPSVTEFTRGIRLFTYPYQRQLPSIKTIDYLMAIWLQPRLKEIGADEILYSNEGFITECPRANFFIVNNRNQLVTPSDHILKGITRKKIIDLASPYMEVIERKIGKEELSSATEAFICSTTKSILPVNQIDEVILPSHRPVSEKLAGLLKRSEPPPQQSKLSGMLYE